MRHGSLFSGIGGFDLAAEWMGWENVFHCELNEFGKKVLNYYWPNAISYDDITKTDFTIHRGNIDILTGGFPCQPYSLAGKQKGKEDERHLWPEMLRAIREIAPIYVVGENVPGIVSWSKGLVFHEVQTDLENEGYEVQPVILPACAVNAPHRRERVWFVAYASGKRCDNRSDNRQKRHVQTNCGATEENKPEWNGRIGGISETGEIITDTSSARFSQSDELGRITEEGHMGIDGLSKIRTTANASNERFQGCEKYGSIGTIREKRNEQFTRLLPSNWEIFPTESPICSGDDGVSTRLDRTAVLDLLKGRIPREPFISEAKHRTESIKAYGNAIVPQVVYQIFKAINDFDQA